MPDMNENSETQQEYFGKAKTNTEEVCPLCKKGKIIKKPYGKSIGYFYQCNYCGLVK